MDSTYQARWMARHAGTRNEDAAELFELTQPTPDELRARAASTAKSIKTAPAPVQSSAQFALTGSNRPADQAGQSNLF